MHTPQTQPTKIPEAYGATEISAHIKERFRIQSWIGASVACAAIASLLLVVGLVVFLAVDGRPADYIEGVIQPLQPFLRPVIGAVVGYALGERDR
jgi:hypothetical protein